MKNMIRKNEIRNAEVKLRYQMKHLDNLHYEMSSCLKELARMIPMELECRQLSEVMEKMQENIYKEQQLADALITITDIYGSTEERVVERAWGSTLYRSNTDLTQVTVPHYESGLIRA